MARAGLHRQYLEHMRHHPYGYALYEPQSAELMYPGCCGYFDTTGYWTPLVDLSNLDALKQHGIQTEAPFINRAPGDQRSWGPKTTKTVKGRKIDLSVEASLLPAGIPLAEIGALFKFDITGDFGAILLTQPPVQREGFLHASTIRTWSKRNAAKVAKLWPDVKDHGMFVVTSIYTTQRAKIHVWSGSRHEVTVGFKAGATEIGEIAPSTEWYTERADDGWVEVEAKQLSDQKVVFVGGLHYRFRKLAPILPEQHVVSETAQTGMTFRGYPGKAEEETFEIVLEDELPLRCQVRGEAIGEIEHTPRSKYAAVPQEDDF